MAEANPATPAMQEPDVLGSVQGGVATLTLNRPKQLNSLTTSMLGGIDRMLAAWEADASVRCVVLAGSGRAFCAGQDLSDPAVSPSTEPGASPKDLGEHIARSYMPVLRRLRRMPVPTLAVVHGVAAGAGANIALGCDIVVAGRSASFIQAFTKIGLLPDSGGTWLLPRTVGRAKALGLALLADKLPADEAERIGLIWRCVDDAELGATASALAQQLAAMPLRALAATRAAIDASLHMDYDDAVQAEARLQGQLGAADDYAEGVRAFMERRAPVFKDR